MRPDSVGLAPLCSIPTPDIRARRSEIVGSRSALRDIADVPVTCNLVLTMRLAAITSDCRSASNSRINLNKVR